MKDIKHFFRRIQFPDRGSWQILTTFTGLIIHPCRQTPEEPQFPHKEEEGELEKILQAFVVLSSRESLQGRPGNDSEGQKLGVGVEAG